MRIFFSAGEPSGDLHGANLIKSLVKQAAGVECVGFGGERMQAAGCRLLYPLSGLAVMGFVRVIANLLVFVRLLIRAERYFKTHRPNAVVLIDYPGFNWWLARRAKAWGIPVIYFVPPQLWAWASWRVRKMRKLVDFALCSLPFEEAWFRDRGVQAYYLGHPYFDELAQQELDTHFLEGHVQKGRPIIALLPGSRKQEVDNNLKTLVRSATLIHSACPEARFLFACYRPSHRDWIEAVVRDKNMPYVEVACGRTPEIIHLADACIAVSGSVGLELLFRKKPTVVIYRVPRIQFWSARWLLRCRYISIVNLLAGRAIFPEYLTAESRPVPVAQHVIDWLANRTAYERIVEEIAELRDRVVKPGACDQAARFILERISSRPAARPELAA